MAKPKNIVFLSLETWDEVWRRNQLLCTSLIERHPDLKILWVNPPEDAWRGPGSFIRASKVINRLTPINKQITQLTPVKPLPNVIGRACNRQWLSQQLGEAISHCNFNQYILWINNVGMPCPSGSLVPSSTIYDITDDWAASNIAERQRLAFIADDQRLCKDADCVIVCSQTLFDQKDGRCRQLKLISNGVESARLAPAALNALHRPKSISSLTGPIAGYVGSLQEDRLDLDLICNVATSLSAVNFVFVGPIFLSKSNQQRLEALPNIHLIGTQPYAVIPEFYASFDVCLNPHKVNTFTDSLDPLKLYEYLSTGKPVISTKCAGFRDLDDLLFLSDDAESFARQITKGLQPEPAKKQQARIHWAGQHSWEGKAKQVEQLLGWTTGF